MDAHLEVTTSKKTISIKANGADMVIGHEDPLYEELRMIVDHVIKSASRNTRQSVACSLTVDDLIIVARERLEQLEEHQRNKQDDAHPEG